MDKEQGMKRKVLLTMLCLATSVSIVACGKGNTTERQEVIATEQTTETEEVEEPIEQETETEMIGLDDIDNTSSSETTMRTDYPDNRSDHQAAWDDFCENWNESDYGTTTAGKKANDFPYYGPTGYDVTLLEYRTTDKGYTVRYDTNTGRVYYSGMMLPTGSFWQDRESGAVITQYLIDNNINNIFDLTYAEFQELLGTYAGD